MTTWLFGRPTGAAVPNSRRGRALGLCLGLLYLLPLLPQIAAGRCPG